MKKLHWIFSPNFMSKKHLDGTGSTVKQSFQRAVKTGNNHISDTSEYASLAKERNPQANIAFISSNEIERENNIYAQLGEDFGCSKYIKTSLY